MLLSVLGALTHSIELECNLTRQQIKMARAKFERVFRKRQIMQGSPQNMVSFQAWNKC